MEKKNLASLLLFCGVLLTVGFIFANSLRPAEASLADSNVIIELIRPLVDAVFPGNEWNLVFVVRKCAHFAEFFLLGALCMGLVWAERRRRGRGIITAALFAVLAVGVADEVLQSLGDRSAMVTDVVIDFCGALAGICLICVLRALKLRKRKK